MSSNKQNDKKSASAINILKIEGNYLVIGSSTG